MVVFERDGQISSNIRDRSMVLRNDGLDLSVGSIFAIANLVALYCVHVLSLDPILTLLITMGVGATCGAFNGFFIGIIGIVVHGAATSIVFDHTDHIKPI